MVDIFTIINITLRSLAISSGAALIASLWSIPISTQLSISRSPLSKLIISLSNALVGFPTVVVGLLTYLLISRSGPLGGLGILYTPYAIILGQAILITPLMISLGVEVVATEGRELIEMSMTFGATSKQILITYMEESIPKLLAVSILGFQRAIGELGIALMLGGNIKGITRVFTTAIALEIKKGEFELAITLGIILIVIDFIIVLILRLIGWKK